MARRGGVKRISASIYEETRLELRRFLEVVMRVSVKGIPEENI
jgi:histone H3/H4